MHVSHFVYRFISYRIFGFSLLTLMNNASVNIHVQVFVWMYVFISLGCVSMSGISRSFDNFMFNNLGNWQIVFQNSYTILIFHKQQIRVPISPYPHHYSLLFMFLVKSILGGVKCYVIVVLICIFLMSKDVEHLFLCLLNICISSLEKCLDPLPIF